MFLQVLQHLFLSVSVPKIQSNQYPKISIQSARSTNHTRVARKAERRRLQDECGFAAALILQFPAGYTSPLLAPTPPLLAV